MARKLGLGLFALFAAAVLLTWAAGKGWFGAHEGKGEPSQEMRPEPLRRAEAKALREAATNIGVWKPKQILFGDLHVHTTFSLDAFLFSLPPLGSEGAHPPSDACDFARHCSALDFWSINDHAEGITPAHWRETVAAIRQCNAVAGDPADPDTVAFLGWEWTQVGTTPADHYGHKNVVLAHTEDERIPRRPIDAARFVVGGGGSPYPLGLFALLVGGRLHDFARYQAERAAAPACDPDANVHDLPADCTESAATPEVLFRKLREWGHDALVIPHGTSWGFYTPPGSAWDKQLAGAQHDPERQRLLELYSGHGDSEVYRDWREVEFDAAGEPLCPQARSDYLPMCVRAGQIIRARCEAAGLPADECERRERDARANAAAAGVAAHRTVPGARGSDWLDAGQCRDCREPAYHYRPKSSAQYMLALGNFDDAEQAPRRFRFGFMASSDNHYARPGTGYKEIHRRGFTESLGTGPRSGPIASLLQPPREEPSPESRPFTFDAPSFQVFETERQASFLTTGGLVAVHSEGRDRSAIWDALERKEIYGTTGQRTLLWFELLNPPGSRGKTLPMGGEVAMTEAPIFQVRAVGSFEQQPGCPESAASALGEDDLERICKGECYYPSDQRRRITRIEVVKIRPQLEEGEAVGGLISDPWRVLTCEPDPTGCTHTFPDRDFAADGRDAVYYARVFEAPIQGVNGDNLRCSYDEAGNCTSVKLCPGEGGDADDCLGEKEPRAWSSPIFVDFGKAPR